MTVESAKHYRALAAQYRAFGFNLVPLGSDKRPALTGVAPHGGLMRFRTLSVAVPVDVLRRAVSTAAIIDVSSSRVGGG